MSDTPHLDNLPDLPTERCATPKYATPSRLDDKDAAEKADKAAETAWKKALWIRDQGLCRCCKKKVLKTLALTPLRGERHHVVGRADRVVRWDTRNALLLCLRCHSCVERNELRIIGRAWFTATNGKRYIDTTQSVAFTKPRNGR